MKMGTIRPARGLLSSEGQSLVKVTAKTIGFTEEFADGIAGLVGGSVLTDANGAVFRGRHDRSGAVEVFV